MTQANQAAFDFAVRHMAKQKAFGLNERFSLLASSADDYQAKCAYRNAAGQTCIVGGMIKEGCYDPRFENSSQRAIPRDCLVPEVREADLDFMSELQRAHDYSSNSESTPGAHFVARLRTLAAEENLNLDVLNAHLADFGVLSDQAVVDAGLAIAADEGIA